MALDFTPNFDAPIPGQSLTAELGSRPWQSKPQYTTVDEAIKYYMDRLTSDEFMDQVLDVLEMGVSVVDIADSIQTASVMEGLHTIDVGVLVSPVIAEMIMFIADSADIKYVTGLDNPEKDKVSPAKISKIIKELREEMDEKEMDEEETEVTDTEEEMSIQEEPKGLMSRRS